MHLNSAASKPPELTFARLRQLDRGDAEPDSLTATKFFRHAIDFKLWLFGFAFCFSTMPAYAFSCKSKAEKNERSALESAGELTLLAVKQTSFPSFSLEEDSTPRPPFASPLLLTSSPPSTPSASLTARTRRGCAEPSSS